MTPLFASVLVAALVGSPHCVGMCGSLACAASGGASDMVAYHTGRIATYAALGALSGALGQSLPGPPWVGSLVAAALLVGFAASLAGILPDWKPSIPGLGVAGARLARRSGWSARAAFGVVNGLLPCGLVYATLAVPVALADPWAGAAAMTLFGVGTVPALLVAAWGLRRALAHHRWSRRALAAAVLVSGLASLAHREGLFSSAGASPATEQPCHR